MRWLTLLLIFIVVLAAGISIYVELTGKTITGKPLQYVGLNISITTPPGLSIISPSNGTYFVNSSIPLNYSITGTVDTIWYNLDLGGNKTITSPFFFNTTEGSHTLYLYANNTIGMSTANISFFVDSTRFKVINEPWGNKVGNSTNFSIFTYEEIQNLSNIILEYTDFGKIQFNQNINMTSDSNFSDNLINLSEGINVSFNRIEVNSTILPNFNKRATLSLYGLTFSNPRILIDGEPCPSALCKNESYSGGTLRFNVTQFSVYSAEETPVTTTTVITVGGGGGGGGGRIIGYLFPRKATSFSTDVSEIKIMTTPGKVITKNIIVTNNLDKQLTLDLSKNGLNDFLNLNGSKLILNPKESREISIDIVVKASTIPEMYIGKLILTNSDDNAEQSEILIIMEVESEGVLLDVNAEVLKEYSSIPPGKDVLVKVSLFNLAESDKRKDITMEYIIKNELGEKIREEKETVAIETQMGWVKRITIPMGTLYGKYVIYIMATTADGKVAGASDTFNVVAPETAKIYILTITLSIIVLGIIIYFSIIRRGKTEEIMRKLDISDIVGG